MDRLLINWCRILSMNFISIDLPSLKQLSFSLSKHVISVMSFMQQSASGKEEEEPSGLSPIRRRSSRRFSDVRPMRAMDQISQLLAHHAFVYEYLIIFKYHPSKLPALICLQAFDSFSIFLESVKNGLSIAGAFFVSRAFCDSSRFNTPEPLNWRVKSNGFGQEEHQGSHIKFSHLRTHRLHQLEEPLLSRADWEEWNTQCPKRLPSMAAMTLP